jgi:hypothetical protein
MKFLILRHFGHDFTEFLFDLQLGGFFFKTIPRLYLSGKFSFVVTTRLDTRIEWFFVYEMHVSVTNVSPREYLT